MSSQDKHPRPPDAIRARADELAARGEPVEPSEDLDVLASLIEGTASLDEIDDDTLARCLKARGTAHFVQALVAGQDAIRESQSEERLHTMKADSPPAEVVRMPVRQHTVPIAQSWWRNHSGWLAAASVAFVTIVAVLLGTEGKVRWSELDKLLPITSALWDTNVPQTQEATFQRHGFQGPDTVNVDPAMEKNLEWLYQQGIGVPQIDKKALVSYRKAAEQGDAWGQNNVGWMYQYGRGVPQDNQEAVVWYRKAAEQGDAWGQNNLGWMYQYGRGVPQDDQEAVVWYRKAAEQGDAWARNRLGWMYANGDGVPQDDQEAVVWYRKAAEQGNHWGQFHLGEMYLRGIGVPQDNREAVVWYRKAAEKGNTWGQNRLGQMYQYGRGVPQDNREAVVWYRKAAEKGESWGQNNLGQMYQYGRGVPQDNQEAVVWYRKAARQWNEDAMIRLAESYRLGLGVTKNDVSAYMWYSIAATKSSAEGKIARDWMAQQLSSKQLQQARELAQRCQDSNFQECK